MGLIPWAEKVEIPPPVGPPVVAPAVAVRDTTPLLFIDYLKASVRIPLYLARTRPRKWLAPLEAITARRQLLTPTDEGTQRL